MYRVLLGTLTAGILAGYLALDQTSLGTVTLGQAVLANGETLAAGTYQVRLTALGVTPALGQSASSERWIEFMKAGQVAGREVASIVPEAEVDTIAEGPRPKANASRVDLLKGGDYVRVWINRDGVNYLIHMPPVREAR